MDLTTINKNLENKSPLEVLSWALSTFGNKISLASSLGLEDQVLTDMCLKIDSKIRIFFLDTGRIYQETYDLLEKNMEKYQIFYDIYFPKTDSVEKMTNKFGPNSFYKSIELRRKCCEVRKVEPLKRALKGLEAWITGIRRNQSIIRIKIQKVEWDSTNNLYKINPLADWTENQVWKYIKQNKIPYNNLHDEGYPSIGCVPCTRAILPGEDIRSGRWWWETPENRECGIHKR
ncbi:MAG: phosphoadenylyl-sulfate reductase [Candidatus Helarchaeota archaeon]